MVLSLMAPNVVLAQAPGGGEDPIGIYRQTGIDSAQEEKIRALAENYEKSEDDKAHKMIDNLNKLKALSLAPDLDEKLILDTQTTINKLQSEMALDKIHLLISIRKVLNKNQRIKLVSLLQSRNKASGPDGPSQ
jgi:Spy/CpxP family protein refolding chaperone